MDLKLNELGSEYCLVYVMVCYISSSISISSAGTTVSSLASADRAGRNGGGIGEALAAHNGEADTLDVYLSSPTPPPPPSDN